MAPPLRNHLHDAVRRIRSIERRCRRTFDDLDALDVLARHVSEAEAGDHAVDDDERILPAADAGRAPEAQRRLGARLCRVRHEPHTGDLPRDGRQCALARHRLQLLLGDTRHGERQLLQ